MKHSLKPILFLAAILILGFTSEASAQNQSTLSARLSGVSFGKSFSKYRVSDSGRPLRSWRQQMTYRATNDTFVYRSQNKASTRHVEVSSPELIFHAKNGRVRRGHVFQRRGN